MSQVVAVTLLVAFLGGLVFFGLLFPVWMVVHSATSDRISKNAKGVWIAVIVISWTIGAAIYAVFASGRRALRWIGGAGLAIGLLAVVGFLVGESYLKGTFPEEIRDTVVLLNQAELVELAERDRETVRGALARLEEETRRSRLLSDRGIVIVRLNELIKLMLQDGALSQAEHDEWVRYYETRHLISRDALEEHVRSLRRRR